MITEPKILFLDEPTLGLDVKARKILWDIIEEIKKNPTVLLTTHYLEEEDRIGIVSRGKMQAIGTREEITAMTGSDSFEDAFLKLAEEEM